jgi:hypothetical protein
MGGSLICREPTEALFLEAYDNIREIMQQVGWMEYVQCLQGYDDQVALEFTLNYRAEHSMVAGAQVEVTKETLAEVIGLPRSGERWYTRRTSQPEIMRQFLEPREALVKKGTMI